MKNYKQIKAVIAGLVLSSAVLPVAMAEDIEIYTDDGLTTAAENPNILFLVDTSTSMATPLTVRNHYDPSITYVKPDAVNCQTDGIYFVGLNDPAPVCSTAPTNYFNRASLDCDVAKFVYTADGTKESPAVEIGLSLFGTYSDQFARYNDSITTAKKWELLPDTNTPSSSAERDYMVECLSDSGKHGSNASKVYMEDGAGGYTATVPTNLEVPHPVWSGGVGHMKIYDGNYLNYVSLGAAVGELTTTRLEELKRAVSIMVSTNNRVNVGLISLDESDAKEGGAVQYQIQDIGMARNNFNSQVLPGLSAEAFSTLSETYYEALLYYGGKNTDYGSAGGAAPATVGGAKETGGKYLSPVSSTCGTNYIVVLSDGTPTDDNPNTQNADGVDRFDLLPGMSKTICNTSVTLDIDSDDNLHADNPGGFEDDNCLPELAEWANTHDIATEAKPAQLGDQNIITHTIAFALKQFNADGTINTVDKPAIDLLRDTKTGENSRFFIAQTGEDLVSIFANVIADALQVNTTFSSPAVSVNAFNRSTHLDDLYFTLFKPHPTKNAWDGNLKKYKLKFDTNLTTGVVTPFIADKTGAAAVDVTTGFFKSTSESYWSVGDGSQVNLGGVAGKMPSPDTTVTPHRKVYTITGEMTDTDVNGVYVTDVNTLSATANSVSVGNDSLTVGLLGTTGRLALFQDAFAVDIPYRTTLINWAEGMDVLNQYGAVDTTDDARLDMGDPLHAEPALVQYGQTTGGDPIMTAFVATNDGYLHAFNVATDAYVASTGADAGAGIEEFSFIPQDLLTRLPRVMENAGGPKTYGLDGSVVAWIKDDNNDGIDSTATGADPAVGDHVYLYFGMRRGGNNIYALNVTDLANPVLMWEIKSGIGDYANLGQTWSTVNVEKIKDGTTEKTVLIFGGGYDTAQDSVTVRTVDTVGNAVYIADAATGARLWVSSNADIDYSIPARIKPLDISGDGYVDRFYAVDMGGQVFRFDINNTNGNALASSITSGRIADLAGATDVDARRFYYPPDVALIDGKDGVYHSIMLSSGYRAHPLNTTIHDRIYMIKDRNTGLLTANDQYKYDVDDTDPTLRVLGALTETNLKNVTANLAGGEGITAGGNTQTDEIDAIGSGDGWYINLSDEDNSDAWIGEKGLAEPLIIEGIAVISTYIPPAAAPAGTCIAPEGFGRAFLIDVEDGTAAYPSDADLRSERHMELSRAGIPPSPNVVITSDGEPTLCIGTECQAADFGLGIRKTYWYEVH